MGYIVGGAVFKSSDATIIPFTIVQNSTQNKNFFASPIFPYISVSENAYNKGA